MYSTYKQVIDDIRFAVNENEKLSVVNDETLQVFVNKWQHILCLECLIEDSFTLSLKSGEDVYELNDALGKPESIRSIKAVEYVVQNYFSPKIEVVDIDYIVHLNNSLSCYTSPSFVALWINNGKKSLRFFTTPTVDVDVRIYYYVTFDERYHNDSDLDDTLVISSDYETLLKYGVQSDVYRSFLKDDKRADVMLGLYSSLLTTFRNRIQQSFPKMKVTSF